MADQDDVEQLAYTYPQAAVVMGAKENAVRELTASGQLGFVKVGNYHLIPRFEIVSFLERNLTRAS